MKKSSYTHLFLGLSMLALTVTVGINYIIDPFTYYHQPWTTINFSKNQRYSNPGLARQFEYESVLMGTSHVMELESGRFSEIVGMPSLNLSISAGLFREQSQLTELVLKQNKARSIYWEMNFGSFMLGDILTETGQEYPQYLYAPTFETPLRYLMSFDTLIASRNALRNAGEVTIDNRNELPVREFSRDRVIAHWNYQMSRWTVELKQFWDHYQKTIEPASVILDRHLRPILEQNPSVTFKLFLPPTSILFLLLHENMGNSDLENWLLFRDALAEIADDYSNTEIYDFQNDWHTMENLDIYSDLEHFNEDVLESLFFRMEQGKNLADKETVLKQSVLLKEAVTRYGKTFCSLTPSPCPDSLKTKLGIKKPVSDLL
jgi:hypothetical protein